MAEINRNIQSDISHVMRTSFLDYAMSVIVARALPDVRDGLKPVHRRILYMMAEMGIHSSGKFVKSARVVGEVMGKLHPHGDLALYQTLVRLAQDFSMRYTLVTGQGNFGSIDNDPAAAMRYTEVRLSPISNDMLTDIDKDTVDFIDNFDGTLKEPTVLPSALPNLLLMGAEGIAVGMATKIPTHNLGEVVNAAIATIKQGKMGTSGEPRGDAIFTIKKIDTSVTEQTQPDTTPANRFDSAITVDEIMTYIKGPDFPTAGYIFDPDAIRETYRTGRGSIVLRGKAEIEEGKNSKYQIIISEIPYQMNKAALVTKIADLVKDKKLDGISDLRDESDRHGIRVVVELKRDAKPKAVLNNLYKKTELSTTFPVNMVALVDGTPMTLNIKQVLVEHTNHRFQVVRRRTEFDLKAAKARAHILEGLKIALDHLDEVIQTIRAAADADDARTQLMAKFGLSEIQATAILDMQLRRLAALERKKIEDEYLAVIKYIGQLEDILAHPEKILGIIENELIAIKAKYADDRRTKIITSKAESFSEEDLIPNEEEIVIVTSSGYIKRTERNAYRTQKRGGKGVVGMKTKDEDDIAHLLSANTHDNILFFTDKGRVFKIKVWELPEGTRQAKGQAIINLININQGETLQSILALPASTSSSTVLSSTHNSFTRRSLDEGGLPTTNYLFMVTRKGTVKKTKLESYENVRNSGLIAIKLEAGDELKWVHPTAGSDNILLISHEGKSIRFVETDVRPTGRDTMGVRGIMLRPQDYIVGMEILPTKIELPADKRRKNFKDILVVMEKGIGKRTDIAQFPTQNRGGQGVKVAEVTDKTGKVMCSQIVDESIDQIILTSKQAQIIKLPLKNIPRLGRATQGVILMRFSKDSPDTVSAVAYLKKEEEETVDVTSATPVNS